MKGIITSTFFSAFALCSIAQDATDIKQTALESIQAGDLKKHLVVLASDEYEGRETGEKGQKMAASYLEEAYKSLGLLPGANGSFRQEFHLIRIENEGVNLKVGEEKLSPFEDFFYFKGLGDQSIEVSEFVFAGYGIEDGGYSDYKGLDLSGKVVVIMNGEPAKKGKFVLTGNEIPSEWSFDRKKKMELAKEKGAKALIVVMDDFDKQFGRFRGFLMAKRLTTPDKLPNESFPIFYGKQDILNHLFKGNEKALAKIQGKLEKGKPCSKLFPGAIDIQIQEKKELVGTENMIAILPGTDLKDEYLVISSHYDHIGKMGDEINNGADDDGSGTVSVLELAEAFKMAKDSGQGPRRSVVFMNFTGEEKGLLGSEYYSNNPIYPLESTVTNLNIDMIGRRDAKHEKDPRYVYIIGSDKLSSDLHTWSEQANTSSVNIELDYTYNDPKDPNRFYYRSDHYNFAKHGIPVIFYFTGVHEDYHKPTDTVDKIEFDKMEEIVQLVFETAWTIANADNRPVVDRKSDFE